MKHQDVRGRLIESTISVIANEGLDKTTTKPIVKGTGINEAYIYRFFADKEDLFAKIFTELDEELVKAAMDHIAVMYIEDLEFKSRCNIFFESVWGVILRNREKCLTFIRYYYSPYFQKYSTEEHKKRYEPLVAKFNDAFKPEANTWMILNRLLNVILDFAVKIFNNDVPNKKIHQNMYFCLYILLFSNIKSKCAEGFRCAKH